MAKLCGGGFFAQRVGSGYSFIGAGTFFFCLWGWFGVFGSVRVIQLSVCAMPAWAPRAVLGTTFPAGEVTRLPQALHGGCWGGASTAPAPPFSTHGGKVIGKKCLLFQKGSDPFSLKCWEIETSSLVRKKPHLFEMKGKYHLSRPASSARECGTVTKLRGSLFVREGRKMRECKDWMREAAFHF